MIAILHQLKDNTVSSSSELDECLHYQTCTPNTQPNYNTTMQCAIQRREVEYCLHQELQKTQVLKSPIQWIFWDSRFFYVKSVNAQLGGF